MTKHWFIAHLIDKYTKGKTFGLDVGIGKDNWSEFKNCKMIGVDIKLNQKIDLLIDLEKPLPFRDSVFDIAIAVNSINYVENGRYLLNEINRVLKDNAVFVVVVDNENSKNFPNVWEQMYLDRVLKVTGFRSILSKNWKDYFYAKWYNRTSVYAFSVAKKIHTIKETYAEKCYKCGKPLGKNWKINSENKKPQHIKCQVSEVTKQWARSYNVETTHPDN